MPPLPHPPLPGVILAGGRSTRMGGGDKALRQFGGRPLLSHVIERLAGQCAPLAISANGEAARFAAFALPVLPDTVPGFAGPLAGVLAGMDWAAALGAPAIVTAAADAPFVPANLADRLLAAAGPQGLALAASPDAFGKERAHPTCGLWPVRLRHDLRAALEGGLRRMLDWTGAQGACHVHFDSLPFDPFFNVNTPDDLALAERLLRLPRVWGITGWKNTGKTGLTERLVAHFTAAGLAVSTVKHAHHGADIDRPGTDSFRHRAAGAREVLLAAPGHWALMHSHGDAREPPLDDLLARLAPVDLVLVEGFKSAPHPKIECHRPEAAQPLMAPANPTIRALASTAGHPGLGLPCFHLDDTGGIAAFILREAGL